MENTSGHHTTHTNQKLTKYEEWGLTQWQIRSIDHTFQHSFWQKICKLQNVHKCEPFWFTSSLFFSKLPMLSTKLSPSFASSARPSLASTSSNALLTQSFHSLTTSIKKEGTNCELETSQLAKTPSSIATSRSSLATLTPFRCTQYFKILNNVAKELSHGGFTFSFLKFPII